MRYCVVFFLLLCWAGAFSQKQDSLMVKRIVDEVLWNSNAYDNLRVLCKEVGPRLSGSKNYEKAVAWGSRQLQAAGADTVYLQACMVPHWERGQKEEGHVFLRDGTSKELNLVALGGSEGTGSRGVKAPVVEVRNRAQLAELGESLRGKIVFFNVRMNPSYINTFDAYAESAWSRSRGPSLAARYGAIGAVVRTLNVNVNDVPNTGGTHYNDSFPRIPAVAISTSDAEFLSQQLRSNGVKELSFYTYCKNLPDAEAYNVIGEIRGSQYPEEILTVGGHLDSWDLAEGAHDDGAGIVQSVEVFRAMKALGIQPKRTVRVVMFANEENGLRGALAYLENARKKGEKHLFALESDAGGFTPRSLGFSASEEVFQRLRQWEPLFRPYGIDAFTPDGGGADVNPLKSIGAVVASLNPDSQRYFDIHHNANDNFDQVSERELLLGAANMAAILYLISEYGL